MSTSHHHRRLPLRSINNLRDLGGYQAVDGRTIRHHILYRAGHLGNLKERDQRKLTALNLHTIIDFRSAEEKQREPDRLPLNDVKVIELPILDEGNSAMMKDMRRRYENNDFDGLDTNLVMFNTYRQFALDFTAEYAHFLQAVLQAQGRPVLWHCTAGKDRAGFAAARTRYHCSPPAGFRQKLPPGTGYPPNPAPPAYRALPAHALARASGCFPRCQWHQYGL